MDARIDWRTLINRLCPRPKLLPELSAKTGVTTRMLTHYRNRGVEPAYQKGEALVRTYKEAFGEEPPRASSRVPGQANGSTLSNTSHP